MVLARYSKAPPDVSGPRDRFDPTWVRPQGGGASLGTLGAVKKPVAMETSKGEQVMYRWCRRPCHLSFLC